MSQDEGLNSHLLAPDFFDAERASVISFASSDVRRAGSDVAAGGLTIKGATRRRSSWRGRSASRRWTPTGAKAGRARPHLRQPAAGLV